MAGAQAIDLNESLKRLLQWPVSDVSALHNPWRYPLMGTLTSCSKYCVRKLMPSNELTCRLFREVELMRIIGWDLDDWSCGGEAIQNGTLSEDTFRSLAGNAFSGYAFATVCAAAMACLRLLVSSLDAPRRR